MASNSKWPRSDTQSYTPQGHKSSGVSNATCCDYLNNDGLGSFDHQDSRRSFHSRQTAEYAIPDDLSNKSDPSYSSIRDPQYYTASSSTEKGRRTGTEGYPMQAWQYPPVAEDQTWKQNLAYPGQQQFCEEYYLDSGQPTQSDSYPTDFGNTYHPQQYSSSYAPSSYFDNNRMPPSYLPITTPVAWPSIVVDEAQDDHIYSQRDDQSSLYQDYLGTNVFSASRRVASVGLDAQRSPTRTPNRNHRHHRTHNDLTDSYDLEESTEGKLSVPRTPRRGQREDDCQRRRRHLTPEGREHAKDVRKVRACKDCRRRKIKVCFVWSSGFGLLLILPKF